MTPAAVDLVVTCAVMFACGVWLGYVLGKWREWARTRRALRGFLCSKHVQQKYTLQERNAVLAVIQHVREST
jgi:membrane protein DedA with SNARE-associated domain